MQLTQIEAPIFASHQRLYVSVNILANVTDQWLLQNINKLSKRLVSRQIAVEECDEGGPYTGIAGVGYALLRVSKLPLSSSSEYINICNQFVEYQMAHSRDVSRSRFARYLTGSLGLYCIQGICESMAGKPTDHIGARFKELVDIGWLLAAVLTLRMETRQHVITDQDIQLVLQAMLKSGRQYANHHKSPAPLFYQWHGKEYLGAAHGLSGIMQMMLSFWSLLDHRAQQEVKQTVDWMVSIQTKEGNFASSTGHIGKSMGEHELVHWCHGATGVIQMLIAAYLAFQDHKYLTAARKCASLIWNKGLLKKGPGICHGVAGSGYAFLLMYRLTFEEQYLSMAKAFASVLMDPTFEQLARVPTVLCPCSKAGVVLYVS
uniref:Uncharacterized protein n=1 Tax=Ditylenchus dipsaci TaxID=166011 RepID=A0A915DU35_9BILA